MRKSIIFIISFFLLAVSCQKENKIEFYELGSEFSISSSGMTSLDTQTELSIDNPLKNLTSVDVVHDGVVDADDNESVLSSNDLGSITISDGVGLITLTESQLGISELDWTANLLLNSIINGKELSRPYSISVESPFSSEDPGITYRDDTTYYFTFKVEPIVATVTSVKIETKVGKNNSYVEKTGSWNAIDSVGFTGSDFVLGDTIFVKITGTAGTKVDSDESKLIVSAVNFENTDSFVLDSTKSIAYDLISAKVVDASAVGDSADVEPVLVDVMGGFELGFESNNNAEFVVATTSIYKDGDVLVAKSTDFSGSVQSVSNVKGGETYVYRTKRGSNEFVYGYIKVVSIDKPQGSQEGSSITFEFKH